MSILTAAAALASSRVSGTPFRGSPGCATIGSSRAEVDVEARHVGRARVGLVRSRAELRCVEPTPLDEVVDDGLRRASTIPVKAPASPPCW